FRRYRGSAPWLRLLQFQVGFQLHVPPQYLAALGQFGLPVEAVATTVDGRLEVEPHHLGAGDADAGRVASGGRHRLGRPADGQITVELDGAVITDPDVGRAEGDRWGVCGVEEVRRQQVVLQVRYRGLDRVDLRGPDQGPILELGVYLLEL